MFHVLYMHLIDGTFIVDWILVMMCYFKFFLDVQNAAKQPGLTSAQMNLKTNIEVSFTAMESSMNNLEQTPDLQIGDDEVTYCFVFCLLLEI